MNKCSKKKKLNVTEKSPSFQKRTWDVESAILGSSLLCSFNNIWSSSMDKRTRWLKTWLSKNRQWFKSLMNKRKKRSKISFLMLSKEFKIWCLKKPKRSNRLFNLLLSKESMSLNTCRTNLNRIKELDYEKNSKTSSLLRKSWMRKEIKSVMMRCLDISSLKWKICRSQWWTLFWSRMLRRDSDSKNYSKKRLSCQRRLKSLKFWRKWNKFNKKFLNLKK